MFKVAVGHSEDVLTLEATQEVIDQIRLTLGELEPQAGILFCSIDFEHKLVLATIRKAFPAIELVGCTTDGELSSAAGFVEDSMTLIVFVSDTIEICAAAGRDVSRQGGAAGKTVAEAARQGLKRRQGNEQFAVILADPIVGGISEIEDEIEAVFGAGFPVIGGAAAAHSKFRENFQFYNEEVLCDSLVLLVFAGPVFCSWAIKGIHSPVSAREPVTLAKNNMIYEIDGKPATEYFRRYIGNSDLYLNYCIAAYDTEGDRAYIRCSPSYDKEKGAVVLNGSIPEGASLEIGTANKATLIESCEESIQQALASYPGSGSPAAALFFSCTCRKMIMGTKALDEAKTIRQYLPEIPFAGFYTYGEFGPLIKGGRYMFHGITFVTLLIGTDEQA